MPTSMVSTHTPRTCERKPPPSVGETCHQQRNSYQLFFKNSCTFHSRGKSAPVVILCSSKSAPLLNPLTQVFLAFSRLLAPLSPHSLARKASRPVIHIHWGNQPPHNHRYTPHASKGGATAQPRASSMGSLEANQLGWLQLSAIFF